MINCINIKMIKFEFDSNFNCNLKMLISSGKEGVLVDR